MLTRIQTKKQNKKIFYVPSSQFFVFEKII